MVDAGFGWDVPEVGMVMGLADEPFVADFEGDVVEGVWFGVEGFIIEGDHFEDCSALTVMDAASGSVKRMVSVAILILWIGVDCLSVVLI